jgi:diguanylate cyclase (GGDEF)-like protein/PAS domain S-box-containing protein
MSQHDGQPRAGLFGGPLTANRCGFPFVRWRTDFEGTGRILGGPTVMWAGGLLSRNVLLVLSDAAEAKVVRRSLVNSRDGPFKVEWVSRCGDAIERLRNQRGEEIAAVVVDLFLSDSQGIETFDQLLRISPQVPILVLSRSQDEDVARLAVQHGAQDYLLEERLDGHSLPKALTSMLERSAHAEALFLENERAHVTLSSIGDAVISTDIAGNITYLNPIAESMTGWSRQEASGRPLQEVLRLIDGDSRQPALNPLAMAILQNKSAGLSPNCLLIRRDGYESAIEDTATPIHDRRGRVTGAVIVFHDVSAARAMSIRMSHLAHHDFLTELPNRMLLNDRLARAIASAQRHRASLAVLFLDVDHFKQINDSLGHGFGDQVLRSIAQRLVTCVRNSDTVSRHGGDEFVVLLSEVTRAEDAALTANKILAAVSRTHRIGHQDVKVTVSVGIGVYPNDGADAETLLKNADIALLRAKAHGRSNHQFFEPALSNGTASLHQTS